MSLNTMTVNNDKIRNLVSHEGKLDGGLSGNDEQI